MEPYFELTLDDKIYLQRTENSKFIEFTLEGEKVKTYDELPENIKEITKNLHDIAKNPENYLDCLFLDNCVHIMDIIKDPGLYLKIPEKIDGLPVTSFNVSTGNKLKNNIEYVYLPDTVTNLAGSSFKGCEYLQSVRLSKNIKIIEKGTFMNCVNLKNIDLSNIERMEYQAFNNCKSFKKINLPNIYYVGEYAFSNCRNLNQIIFSDKLETLSKGSFSNCKKLKEINLSDNVEYFCEYLFENCYELENIKLPKSLTIIQHNCFIDCKKLKNFIAPESLRLLDFKSFRKCGLENIVLNRQLRNLSSCAFEDCNNVKTISLYNHQMACIDGFNKKPDEVINLSNKRLRKENLER